MSIETVEGAYEAMAAEVLAFCKNLPWDLGVLDVQIFEKMSSSTARRFLNGQVQPDGNVVPFDVAMTSARAAMFLRDDLLKSSGARIWGLRFELQPTGKFKLDYSYEPPVSLTE